MGKGFVYQSIGLLGGAPGIGKSTLILQILGRLTKLKKKVLYVSGEESASQIKLRAQRLEIPQEDIFIIIENSLENILAVITQLKPDFIVIDSIQTISTDENPSSAGNQTQVRECTMKILHYSKQNPATFLLVGHITKEGNLAGPKILEHMVDYVLYLEEENNYGLKTLKSAKNRFGSTFETGLFKMTAKGLAEISQPNKVLMSNLVEESISGTAFFPMMQGNRTLLIEIQALVGKNSHPSSLKTSVGLDRSKLLLLLAVLDKFLGIELAQNDVYLNIAGGYRCNEPMISLAALAAILSSHSNQPLPDYSIFLGEVALTGQISLTGNWKDRIKEAERCGFKQVFLGRTSQNPTKIGSIQSKSFQNITDFYNFLH